MVLTKDSVLDINMDNRLKHKDKLSAYLSTHKSKEDNKSRRFYTASRNARLKNRIPKWTTDKEMAQIEAIYKLADLLSKTRKVIMHVDHIVPLNGKAVSGLHTPYNLRVITAKENIKKNNDWNVDDQYD
jgi:hypothetical protein